MWICVVLESFYEKWVNWWFLLEWGFESSFIWIWVHFYVHKPINKLWGQITVLGDSKLRFLGEKWWKTRKNGMKLAGSSLMASSVWKQLAYGQKLAKSELLSDSFPCFAFLRLFHTFLFWNGLWCKHENFR